MRGFSGVSGIALLCFNKQGLLLTAGEVVPRPWCEVCGRENHLFSQRVFSNRDDRAPAGNDRGVVSRGVRHL